MTPTLDSMDGAFDAWELDWGYCERPWWPVLVNDRPLWLTRWVHVSC